MFVVRPYVCIVRNDNWTAKLTQTHTQNTTSAYRSYELLKWRTLNCFMGPQKTTQKWNKSLRISYFYIIWSFSHFYRPKLLRNTIFTANIVMALMCVHAHYADINDMSVWLLCHEKWISISHQFLSNWSRTHEFICECVSGARVNSFAILIAFVVVADSKCWISST